MTPRRAGFLVLFICCAASLWGAFQVLRPSSPAAASLLPPGALLTIESPDFASLLADWNASPEKQSWLQSDDYAVFSRSRLFDRLSGAQAEFANAAGLPPDMQFVSQLAGTRSIFAWYDIGKLEFLYLSQVPSSKFDESALWQSRSKFEQRQSGANSFYIRTDPESGRTVCFAVADGWVLLATREDLIADALALVGGAHNATVQDELWYADAVHAAKAPGDLRMVLNLEKIVPSAYFRSYWIQQNITEMKQYRAAVSDLFRTPQVYREERVLLPKAAREEAPHSSGIAEMTALVPTSAGFYRGIAAPNPSHVVDLLRDRLLDPRPAQEQNTTYAPTVTTNVPEVGSEGDLETRIDQSPLSESTTDRWTPLQNLCSGSGVQGALEIESSAPFINGVFTTFPTAIVLRSAQNWDADHWKSAVVAALEPEATTSELGLSWEQKKDYAQTNGLLPVFLAVRGPYLVLANNADLLDALLQKIVQDRSGSGDLIYAAGFNHAQERAQFARLTSILDRANASRPSFNADGSGQSPAFFSGNVASLSQVFQSVQSESIETHDTGTNITQTVIYRWQ
jgi:hypothetical protein